MANYTSNWFIALQNCGLKFSGAYISFFMLRVAFIILCKSLHVVFILLNMPEALQFVNCCYDPKFSNR